MLSVAIMATMGFTACKNQSDSKLLTSQSTEQGKAALAETTFGVRGNCSMCKKTIEKAANSVDGVSSANWSIDLKQIAVAYDDLKTDEMAIHQAIALSGYDTEKVTGSEAAYNNLPQCCQYDHEMEMSLDAPKDNKEGKPHHE